MRNPSLALTLLLVLLEPASAQAPPTEVTSTAATTSRAVDHWVEAQMERRMIPGLALVVLEKGEVVKVAGYGQADVEHGVRVTPETVFQTGSVGKQFTAAGVMKLVERGRIGLDDAVSEHLGEGAPAFPGVTVRHLLTHTSGVGDYFRVVDYRHDYTDEELVAVIAAQPPEFEPGTDWRYSNSGYVLLGILITRVSGTPYLDFLRDELFRPLGMRTARGISDADIVPNRSSGYQVVDGELKHHEFVTPSLNRTGDGCLYMTVLDFARWDAALYSERALTRASLERMWTPVTLKGGETRDYGFGWSVGEVRGHGLLSHSGGWQGFSAYYGRFVEKQLSVVVLCNRAGAGATFLGRGVLGLYDSALGPWTPRADEVDRAAAEEVVGDYRLGTRTLKVRLEDEGLWLITPDERLQLFGGERGRYRTGDGSNVRFRWNREGVVDRLDAFGLRARRDRGDD
jgi:CubicO group peptidase (beta-lactamase class C family)